MPIASTRWRLGSALATCLLLLPVLGCRADMQNTPKEKTFRPSRFYSDRLSARPLIAGTVPQNGPAGDEVLLSGTINGRLVTLFPFPVTREVLRRGRERFNIFCSPCHGALGNGEGAIVQRGFRRPFSRDVWSVLNDAPCPVLIATGEPPQAKRAVA